MNMEMNNSAKRLPIVLCLDVSPSMNYKKEGGKSSIEMLNSAVRNLIYALKNDVRSQASAEIAFVTFSTNIEMDTEFIPIDQLYVDNIATVEKGGTNMSAAVIRSIEKIENRKAELDEYEVEFYAPFFVLVTDGNPDNNDNIARYEESVKIVNEHCRDGINQEEMIIPFIVGVGDNIKSSTLNRYSEALGSTYIPIKGNDADLAEKFEEAFKFIGHSAKISCRVGYSETVNTIKSDLKALISDLSSR